MARTRPKKPPTKHSKLKVKGASKIRNVFSHRMCPSELVDLMSKIDDDKKEYVKKIGLGFLFDLKLTIVPSFFAKYLVDEFDIGASTWWFKKDLKLVLQEDDLHITLGLPRGGGKDILQFKRGTVSKFPGFNDIHKDWVADYLKEKDWVADLNDHPTLKQCRKLIEESEADSLCFKRNFVLYFVASFFHGSTNDLCPRTFLPNLVDMDNIASLNWCKYAYDRVIDSVSAYQARKTSSNNIWFTGPIVFMMLFYVDRVQYAAAARSRTFPASISWTNDELSKRLASEEKDCKWGSGLVLERISLPDHASPALRPIPEKRDRFQKYVAEVKKLHRQNASVDNMYSDLSNLFTNDNDPDVVDAINKIQDTVPPSTNREKQSSSNDFFDDKSFSTPAACNYIDNIANSVLSLSNKHQELKEAADKEAAPSEAVDKDAADKEAAPSEAVDKEAAPSEAVDKEAVDKEVAAKEAADTGSEVVYKVYTKKKRRRNPTEVEPEKVEEGKAESLRKEGSENFIDEEIAKKRRRRVTFQGVGEGGDNEEERMPVPKRKVGRKRDVQKSYVEGDGESSERSGEKGKKKKKVKRVIDIRTPGVRPNVSENNEQRSAANQDKMYKQKAKKGESNMCHQCQRSDKERVIRCSKCKTKRFCSACIKSWYPPMTEEEIAQSCPVCLGNCNCKACLRTERSIKVCSLISFIFARDFVSLFNKFNIR